MSAGRGGRARGWVTGWRVPLRIARRDARRARGRTALALTLLALPVLAVTTADTLYATSGVTGAESLERRLGAAEARIDLLGSGRAAQSFDPQDGARWSGRGATDVDAVAAVLGLDDLPSQSVPLREGQVRFDTDRGREDAQVLVTDLADPLAAGLVDLTAGRLPTSPDEVVVSPTLADRGPGVGEDLVLASGAALSIVGEAESAAIAGRPFAAALPGSALEPTGTESLLVGGDPVSWDEVLGLNDLGALVVSRAVLTSPPPDTAVVAQFRAGQDLDDAAVTAAVLIAVMVLIEVVLLAGPAFAVGARRQARTLALVAATGGSPRDARRVVLASGVVLGVGGSVLGVVVGLVAAWALRPVLQSYSVSRLGPYDVEPLHLLAVIVFGLISALLAAAVPAWSASRQDVVAVLAGRRGDAAPSRRSPVVGLVLVALGAGLATNGARAEQGGETSIALAAIVCVLGMLLLVPVVVGAVARASRGLPLALRFAARDAARHRSRTVPAVAAVAATVAGVVALGIGASSDEAQSAAGYTALLPVGDAAVSFGHDRTGRAAGAEEVRAALGSVLPAGTVDRVEEVQGVVADGGYVELRAPGAAGLLSSAGGFLAGDLLVAEAGLPSFLRGVEDLTAEQQERVEEVLAAGGVVALSDTGVTGVDEVRVLDAPAGRGGVERTTLPATTVPVEPGQANAQGVVSEAGARAAGLEVATTALVVRGGLSAEEAQDTKEAVAGLAGPASLYVERGYQPPDEVRIVQLVLGGLGGLLMLGGTLTATFLALSDARPDLATLGAVGAAPRTRRTVAAAYALVVGAVGSALGALVGLVPGIAVTYPLTRPIDYGSGVTGPAHYLDVPWVLLGVVVVGLPLLSALVVAATSRSRLPLVARLE